MPVLKSKVSFKTKGGKTVTFPVKKIVPAVKSKAGRKPGQADTKPRQFKHPRFKKKVSNGNPESLNPSITEPTSATPPSGEIALSSKIDTEIFTHGSPPKPAAAPAGDPAKTVSGDPNFDPAQNLPPLNEAPPKVDPGGEAGPKTPDKMADPTAISMMIWGMELNLMGMMFGPEMFPRKFVKDGADPSRGELPYDEGEMVRSAWFDYLVGLGVVIFSPLKALWLAHAMYLTPRVGFVIRAIKGKFGKKKNSGAESPASPAGNKSTPETTAPAQPFRTEEKPVEQRAPETQQAPAETPAPGVHNTEGFR